MVARNEQWSFVLQRFFIITAQVPAIQPEAKRSRNFKQPVEQELKILVNIKRYIYC